METPSIQPFSNEPVSSRRSKKYRLGKWLLIVSLTFAVMLPILHALWLWSATRALRAEVAALIQSGEPMTIAAMKLPSVPEDQNAFVDIEKASEILDRDSAASDRVEIIGSDVASPLTKLEKIRLQAYVDAYADVSPLIRVAAEKPFNISTDPVTSPLLLQPLPGLNKCRSVATYLSYKAIIDHEAGRDDLAVRDLCDMEMVAVAAASQAAHVSALVAIGIRSLQLQRVSGLAHQLKIGPRPREASVDDVTRLLKMLQDDKVTSAEWLLAMRGERVRSLDTIENLPSLSSPPMIPLQAYILRPLLRTDALIVLQTMTEAIATLNEPNLVASQKRMFPIQTRIAGLSRLHMYARLLLPDFTRFTEVTYRFKADRALAAVAIASRLFETKAGHLPNDWQDLVPQYLPTIPLDPLADGALLHARWTGDDPIVWSVGKNTVDEGGVEYTNAENKLREADKVLHLIPQPREFDELMQRLIRLDLDSPISQTTATQSRSMPVKADGNVDPTERPSWADTSDFDVFGDTGAFNNLKTRRDAFAALSFASDVANESIITMPATSPAATLYGFGTIDDKVWKFEIYPNGELILVSPSGARIRQSWTYRPWEKGDRQFWR